MASYAVNNQKSDQKLSVSDVLFFMLAHWWWFVISVVVCVALAWLQCQRSPLIYFRSATVVIKDPANKTSTGGLDRFDSNINKVNITNELLQFKSATLMTEVVRRLDANVNYQIKDRLRMNELYTKAPIQVVFEDMAPERYVQITVVPVDSAHVIISHINGLPVAEDKAVKLSLEKKLRIGDYTDLRIVPSLQYGPAWYGQEIVVTHMPMSSVVGYFQGNMAIRQAENQASILTVVMQDVNPRRAEDVINTLIDVYNEEAIADKNRVAVHTAEFINDRLAIIESELGNVENDLQKFKSDHGIIDVQSSTSRYIQDSQKYEDQVVEQQAQLEWAEFVKTSLIGPEDQHELIPTHTGLVGIDLENQIASYNSLLMKRERLVASSGKSNPVLEELDGHLKSSREGIVRTIDNFILILKQKQGNATVQRSRSLGQVATIPETERKMLSIERQQKIKETLYLFLLNKREENALSQAMADNNARMIDTPKGPGVAILPQPRNTVTLGFLIGMAIPMCILLFQLFMDTKVRDRKDIEGKINIPYLGDIPFDRKQAKRKSEAIAIADPDDRNDVVAEAFRMLRTNLMFFNKPDHPVKVITLSSFAEGAGKTFIVRNLARSLSRARKRVMVIDLDVRKGTLSRTLKANKKGVTDYLVDYNMKLEALIQHFGDIDFIAAGSKAPNAAELLMEKRLDDMMDLLREAYDYILVDNVPVGAVADATIANRVADITIFVARAGRFDRRQLPDIEQLHEENKLHNMVLVLNGTDFSSRYGYYGSYGRYGYHRYGYYGHYGYGYGYGGDSHHGKGGLFGSHKRKKRKPAAKPQPEPTPPPFTGM